MTGALLSAAAGFVIGELMGAKLLERYSKSRLHKLSKQLSRKGILAVAILRMVPVAPYAIVNIVAGASHLNLGRFLLGTAIGMVSLRDLFLDVIHEKFAEQGIVEEEEA